ncbi:MAG: hypothetical protein WCW01_03010 [Gammaproteobacteria bacterium]
MFANRQYPNSDEFDPEHKRIWYVHRSREIGAILESLWGKGPIDPSNMNGKELASLQQRTCKGINILFRNMEKYGPFRNEFTDYRYDAINDMYHCHVTRYVVMWEMDEVRKVINIVNIGVHENFRFERRSPKQVAILKAIGENEEIINGARELHGIFWHARCDLGSHQRFVGPMRPTEAMAQYDLSVHNEAKHPDLTKLNGRVFALKPSSK